LIPLIPLFIQGSIFYNNPLGSLIYQSKVTINPSDYFFYIKNFFKIFSFTSPFIIFGLINYKKLKFFLIIFIVNIFILQLIFSHNVQERFMLSLFPLILPFIASGIDYITKKIKYSSLIIFIIALLILPSSINSIINDPASTKLLIESTKELKDLPQGKMFCNSVPYCSFFGNKEVFIGNEVHKISFPPNKNEFLFILKNESIKYIFLDNYHLEPKYKDFIENNFKLLFHHQNAYKYTKLFLAN
ncbi:hypothetical protein HY498_03430, partial [Candidatus Woesearchaeota archaeon]|nr:hypothetical protein [Candidatus Woesearchaeota archaeon]